MIHDEICTYEVAKLAKEKGFSEMASCYQGYRKDGTLFYFSNIPDGKERVMQTDCLAPTQSLLQRWLREEKGIIVIPYYRSVLRMWSATYELTSPCTFEDLRECFKTYELALEDALKYALENLI